ncbi:MAG: hypothetical protein M0C28_20845 [Candidatus Moduliflexus flocculans]|nr:hypothetical protein [Candidatus Moduliflexus flocculans]
MNRPLEAPHPLVPDGEVFVRMDRTARWQHMLVVAAFSPSRAHRDAASAPCAGRLVAARLAALHRAAAAVFIAVMAWHFSHGPSLTVRGRGSLRDRMPPPERPQSRGPAASAYVDKFDYWAFLFGSAVMIVTGVLTAASGARPEALPLGRLPGSWSPSTAAKPSWPSCPF